MHPAALFSRFIATLIDTFLFAVPQILGVVVLMATPVRHSMALVGLVLGVGLMLLGVAYQLFRDGNELGAGVGKRTVRISVVRVGTNLPCGNGRAAVRNLLTVLFNLTVLLAVVDLILALLDDRRRRLVDHIAGTQVIETPSRP